MVSSLTSNHDTDFSHSVVKEASKSMSFDAARLYVLRTLSALPLAQFEQLIFTLNPPRGVIYADNAPHVMRRKALLDWVEGEPSLGLKVIDKGLQEFVLGAAKPKVLSVERSIGNLSTAELGTIFDLTRLRIRDNSINLAFYERSKLKLFLNGSQKGLEELQELFNSGKLAQVLDGLPIKSVRSIEPNSLEARKACLIQVLRFYQIESVSILASHLASYLDHASDLINDLISQLDLACDFAKHLDLACDLARHLDLAHGLANQHKLAHHLTPARAHDPYHDFYFPLLRTLEYARKIVHELSQADELSNARIRALINQLTLNHRAVNRIRAFNSVLGIDLMRANLSGANLRALDLRGISFEGVDLTDADVTGTLFGDNPGLTEKCNCDLQKRGAILQKLPTKRQ